jgi:hypothetical protein
MNTMVIIDMIIKNCLNVFMSLSFICLTQPNFFSLKDKLTMLQMNEYEYIDGDASKRKMSESESEGEGLQRKRAKTDDDGGVDPDPSDLIPEDSSTELPKEASKFGLMEIHLLRADNGIGKTFRQLKEIISSHINVTGSALLIIYYIKNTPEFFSYSFEKQMCAVAAPATFGLLFGDIVAPLLTLSFCGYRFVNFLSRF